MKWYDECGVCGGDKTSCLPEVHELEKLQATMTLSSVDMPDAYQLDAMKVAVAADLLDALRKGLGILGSISDKSLLVTSLEADEDDVVVIFEISESATKPISPGLLYEELASQMQAVQYSGRRSEIKSYIFEGVYTRNAKRGSLKPTLLIDCNGKPVVLAEVPGTALAEFIASAFSIEGSTCSPKYSLVPDVFASSTFAPYSGHETRPPAATPVTLVPLETTETRSPAETRAPVATPGGVPVASPAHAGSDIKLVEEAAHTFTGAPKILTPAGTGNGQNESGAVAISVSLLALASVTLLHLV